MQKCCQALSMAAALTITYVMQVEAVWIVACNALEKGIAILGGPEACLDLLACRSSQQLERTANVI